MAVSWTELTFVGSVIPQSWVLCCQRFAHVVNHISRVAEEALGLHVDTDKIVESYTSREDMKTGVTRLFQKIKPGRVLSVSLFPLSLTAKSQMPL